MKWCREIVSFAFVILSCRPENIECGFCVAFSERGQFIIPVTVKIVCSLLNGEGDSDKRQTIIHIIRYERKFPPKMSLAHVTFVTTFLIHPLPERLPGDVVRHRNISGHIFT
jgi:hypothetical protein